MAGQIQHSRLWALIKRQHWVITRAQLLAHGVSRHAIYHRLATGRLHRVYRGVYAVGRLELTRYGELMAAVLACGPGACLSHQSAAELWRIRRRESGPIHVSVPGGDRRHPGIVTHRREKLPARPPTREGIPLLDPLTTLVDLAATELSDDHLEAAINQADVLRVLRVERLRKGLEGLHVRGAARLRKLIDLRTFVYGTQTWLERAFVPIARHAGLGKPQPQAEVNGYKVDFYWPELGLVVETDGGTFHRTPSQQKKDRERDHAHTVAGLTPLRFTHGQIEFEAGYVAETLRRVATRLGYVRAS